MLVYGLINSAVLALMALGFNLTFGISGVANFAYGAIYVVAGFLTWTFINQLNIPYALSAALTIALVGIFGALIYRFIIKRIRGLVISEVIATFGISIIILEFLRYVGFIGFKYSLPVFINGSVEILGAFVDIQRLFIIGFCGLPHCSPLSVYTLHEGGAGLQGHRPGGTHFTLTRDQP